MDIAYYPWHWMNQKTEINLYNVSTPTQPKKQTTITIDGALLANRVIGESLYVVTRYVPDIQELTPKPGANPTSSADDRSALIEQASLTQLLPTVTINLTY